MKFKSLGKHAHIQSHGHDEYFIDTLARTLSYEKQTSSLRTSQGWRHEVNSKCK